MGLDTIIVIVLVAGAVGGLIYLQHISAKKAGGPTEPPKK